jgi:glutamate racemase
MNNKFSIGIFDSGIGGLSVYKELIKLMPQESVIYFADSSFNPYGEKSENLIKKRSGKIVNFFSTYQTQTVIVGCNTATTVGISQLRANFPLINFVGMEPGIKPAISFTKSHHILVLATPATLASQSYKQLKKKFSHLANIENDPAVGLVKSIEECQTEKVLSNIIFSIISPHLKNPIDTVVLSSTHFSLVSKIFKKTFPNLKFISPTQAVALQVKKIHIKKETLYKETLFFTSGNQRTLHHQLKHYLSKNIPDELVNKITL